MQFYVGGPCFIFCGVGNNPQLVFRNGGLIKNPTAVDLDHGENVIIPAASRVPLLLGTTVAGVRVEIKDAFRPVQTDLSGDAPDDMLWNGHEALIYADVNFHRESVYAAIASKPIYNGYRGYTSQSSVGTLMRREGGVFPLWLLMPYAGKIQYGGQYLAWNLANLRPILAAIGIDAAQQVAAGVGQAIGAALQGAAGIGQGAFGALQVGAGGQQGAVANLLGAQALQAAAVGIAANPGGAMPAGYRFPTAYLAGETLDPLGTRVRKLHLVFHALRAPSDRVSGGGVYTLYDHYMDGLKNAR